jgi:hypothetical protein
MAFAATAVIEVRTTGSDTQCAGGFNPARGGTDYSQQDAAQATGTVTSSSTTVTATTGIFTSAMVGNYITDGTTFKEITAFTSSLVVTVDSAPSWTAATVYVGGALASPGKAGSVHVSGNTIWIKSGTYSITSATANVAGGCVSLTVGTAAGATRLAGYGMTRGDNGTKPLLQAGSISAFTIVLGANATVAENVAVDGASKTTSAGFSVVARVYRCKASNCTNRGFATIGLAIYCEATGCSSGNAFLNSTCFGCEAHGNTSTPFFGGTCSDCLSYNNTGANTDGFSNNGNSINFQNCTAFGNGRSGFNLTGTAVHSECINCVSVGNTAFGFTTVIDGGLLLNCAAYNNTSGATNGFNGTNDFGSSGLITLTTDPFVASASANFALNSTAGGGAACRAAGVIGAFPAGTTTGYQDVGAAQHQDSGSGGGLIRVGMQGGFGG